jgi:hypothetical protein
VRLLGRAEEAEVVAAFLRAELDSSRYGDRLRAFLARQVGLVAHVLGRIAAAGRRGAADPERRGRRRHRRGHEPLALALHRRSPPPELIVLTGPRGSRLVLVEGHFRLTAYALFPDVLPPELVVFLGVAEDAESWWAY